MSPNSLSIWYRRKRLAKAFGVSDDALAISLLICYAFLQEDVPPRAGRYRERLSHG
jgi:hypothetical protein